VSKYTVRTYHDAAYIGTATLTAEQFATYEDLAQQPEGIIRLGALPRDYYVLTPECQDTPEETVVYLD
jgi:hypothetical protein